MTNVRLPTWDSLIIIEGLGILGYFSSTSGLQSNSSSSSSELWETLYLRVGDSRQSSSSVPSRWQIEVEFVSFTFLVLVEQMEIELTVLSDCLYCCSCRLLGRASGWHVTGAAVEGTWLFLLCWEMFGSWADAGSVLASLGLSKQWPRDEQGSLCMLVASNMTKSVSETSCTDIRWTRGFLLCGRE